MPVPLGQESAKEPAPSVASEDVGDAVRALEAGDLVTAKAIVDRLLIRDRMAQTIALREAGQPMEALSAADEALAVASLTRADRATLLVSRGRAAFAAAASDPKRAPLYEEAFANFEEAAKTGAGVSAAFRASRAARMIGDMPTALDLARAGARWIGAGEGRDAGLDLDQPYTQTLAEAAFSSYIAAPKETPEEVAARAELFEETKAALEATIGGSPTDAAAYVQLSNLYLWEGRRAESLQTLESALSVQPADEALHTAFVKALGDDAEASMREQNADSATALTARFDAIIGRYEAFRSVHPDNALGYWYGGFEQFYEALNFFENGEGDAASFVDAEALFRRCRELGANYTESCIDYEILCRVGQGWCEYQAEQNEAAIAVFLTAEDLRPQDAAAGTGRVSGMEMRLPRGDGTDRLPSALAGLDFVTRRFIADPTDVEALSRAAGIGDMMFALRPKNPNLANNAGFLNRDAGVLWETRASQLFSAAATDEERAAAQNARDRGEELMQRSWTAYQVAAELLPDDVRVVNDAGLVMAYYLRTDTEAAERYFLDAVKDGEPQLAAGDLTPEAHEALVEAWGDAHQNMGILEMTLRQRPAEAKTWFTKALEIGPASRNWLESVLPLLDTWSETGERPAQIDAVEARSVWVHNPPRD
jgi:tetratricopeptide (TPR) repeat protein